MTVWGIADLHLAYGRPLGRDRYAARWREQSERIAGQWRGVVGEGDLVLIPGDISMALDHRQVQPDLRWLERLPGTKVLSPGNHDRWWNTVEAVRRMLRPSLLAVDGDAIQIGRVTVCGARGEPPGVGEGKGQGGRSIDWLEGALKAAAELRAPGGPLYVLWHFSPFGLGMRESPLSSLLERYEVSDCVYGHLHRESQWSGAVQGVVRGVRYHFVAADAIGFRPLRLGSGLEERSR